MPPLDYTGPVRRKKVRKKKPGAREYAALPAPARKQQIASKGVLAPGYEKAAKAEHTKRVAQLKSDPKARVRLANRQIKRIGEAVPTAKGLKITPVKAKKKGGSKLAAVTTLAKYAIPGLAQANAVGKATGIDVKKAAKNAPGDAAELVTTLPASLYKAGEVAVKNRERVDRTLDELVVKPYKELAKDPRKAFEDNPVTTLLMVDPLVRVPLRAGGKVARVTGKQDAMRPDATLPGTAIRVKREGSKNVATRAVQARRDKKKPAPTVESRPSIHVEPQKRNLPSEKNKPKVAKQRVPYKIKREHGAPVRTTPLERMVDNAADVEARTAIEMRTRASKDAGRQAKAEGVPRKARAQVAAEAAAAAGPKIREEGVVRRAEVFGATRKPKVGKAQIVAAEQARFAADTAARQAIETARAGKPVNDRVKSLRVEMRKTQVRKNAALREQRKLQGEFQRVQGRAEVLSRNVGGEGAERLAAARTVPEGANQFAGGGRGVQQSAAQLQAATKRVQALTNREQQIARAINKEQGRVIGGLKSVAAQARAAHIDTKKTHAEGEMVDVPGGKGLIYEHAADAIKVANSFKDVEMVVRSAGRDKGYMVVPRTVADRFHAHQVVGSSKAVGAVGARATRRAFGRTVLTFSKNMAPGAVMEGALRSGIKGAGPTSYVRGKRALRAVKREQPDDVAREFRAYTVGSRAGGGSGKAGLLMDFIGERKTLADQMAETNSPAAHTFGRAVTRVNQLPFLRHMSNGFERATNILLGDVQSLIERNVQTAMLGKVMSDAGISGKKAIDAWAKGSPNPAEFTHFAEKIHESYGRYRAMTPAMREMVMHNTPFIAWTANSLRLLLITLPAKHPLASGLIADLEHATEDWRRANGFSLRPDEGVERQEPFRFGGPLARVLPSLPTDPGGAAIGLAMPHYQPAARALMGIDYRGKPLSEDADPVVNALLEEGEALLRGTAQVDRALSLGDRYVRRKKRDGELVPAVGAGKTGGDIKRDIVKQVNPYRPPADPAEKKKVRRTSSGMFGGSQSKKKKPMFESSSTTSTGMFGG